MDELAKVAEEISNDGLVLILTTLLLDSFYTFVELFLVDKRSKVRLQEETNISIAYVYGGRRKQ